EEMRELVGTGAAREAHQVCRLDTFFVAGGECGDSAHRIDRVRACGPRCRIAIHHQKSLRNRASTIEQLVLPQVAVFVHELISLEKAEASEEPMRILVGGLNRRALED